MNFHYETRVFISPRQRLGDIKSHNYFHEYRMKWELISDPIYFSWSSISFFHKFQKLVLKLIIIKSWNILVVKNLSFYHDFILNLQGKTSILGQFIAICQNLNSVHVTDLTCLGLVHYPEGGLCVPCYLRSYRLIYASACWCLHLEIGTCAWKWQKHPSL